MPSNTTDKIRRELASMPAPRLPLPLAYADPAFTMCIEEASRTPELIAEFDRLYGCRIGSIARRSAIESVVDQVTGYQDNQTRKFVEFVHDAIYMRAPDEAINAFRLAGVVEKRQAT